MSRIDQAIQKAAQLRESKPAVAPPSQDPQAAAPVCSATATQPKAQLPCEALQLDHPCLVSQPGDPHPASEPYKKLKSLVLKLTHGESLQNTLLVTSATMGEGKTITALNLALSLAREYDHTALLIDADLRRPALQSYLNLEPRAGLIQVLKDGLPLEQALVKTGLGKLTVLPAGGTVKDPVELLASEQLRLLIGEIKARYPERYVILDTPPALHFADAQALLPAVDGVLFVVREGAANPRQVQAALGGLQGANLLGVVYNDALHLEKKDHYAAQYY